MKKITVLLLLLSFRISAQITLEHTYPGASYFASSSDISQLYIVWLEKDGQKYVHVDRLNKAVKLYNMDHSPYKTISFSAATDLNPNVNAMDVLYISQHLFDSDNEIEFMYCDQYYSSTASFVTQIINEDGALLFTASNEFPAVKLSIPMAQEPIYNTSTGTKMILSATNGDGKVYSLTGTLSAMTVPSHEEQQRTLQLFPNPAGDKVVFG